MREINDKVTGDSYTAIEFNEGVKDDQQYVVGIATGQTFNPTDETQLSKAISDFVAAADYYTDSGTPTAYVLTSIGSLVSPHTFFDGMRVRFLPTNTNTGSATINVSGLGPVSIVQDGNPVPAGTLTAGRHVELWYSADNNWFDIVLTEGVASFTDVIVTGSATIGGNADVGGDVTAAHFNATEGGSLAAPALRTRS